LKNSSSDTLSNASLSLLKAFCGKSSGGISTRTLFNSIIGFPIVSGKALLDDAAGDDSDPEVYLSLCCAVGCGFCVLVVIVI
jgi:hypothetical protein